MDNRLTKYLLYAVGEILLVMIGILLALQVNNWNENRKVKAAEVKLVRQLLQDARADSIFIVSRMHFQQTRDTMFNNIFMLQQEDKRDSLSGVIAPFDPLFYRLAYQSNLITNNPNAYDELSVDTLKSKLREYVVRYDYMSGAIEISNRVNERFGVPLEVKYQKQMDAIEGEVYVTDFLPLMDDDETISILRGFQRFGANYYIQCQIFQGVNQELILLLEDYLKESK